MITRQQALNMNALQAISVPPSAELLGVHLQNGRAMLTLRFDPTQAPSVRRVHAFENGASDGGEIPLRYLGTVAFNESRILHYYEQLPAKATEHANDTNEKASDTK